MPAFFGAPKGGTKGGTWIKALRALRAVSYIMCDTRTHTHIYIYIYIYLYIYVCVTHIQIYIYIYRAKYI